MYFCYNPIMSIIEELESRAVTELELRELLEKYETLYIEEPDALQAEDYYELDLYLEARLSAIEELKENDSAEVKALKAKIKELEAENNALYKRALGKGDTLLNKRDIMVKFSKGSDWALRLLKLMEQSGMAQKMNRTYYAEESDIKEFLKTYKGQALKF